MAYETRKNAAAHARAARLAKLASKTNHPKTDSPDITEVARISPDIIIVDSDSDSDCGYDGGVNYQWSSSEYEPGYDSSDEWTSDAESLAEFEGDELEANLQSLREEALALGGPQIMQPKSAEDWKKAEKNRAWGYTGTSQRSRQRNEKNARERDAFRKEARTS